MKKLFTTMLVLFILTTSIGIRTNAQENMQDDESYLTVEVIEHSFWEELESCKYPQISKEDEYISWLIRGIGKPHTIPAFGDCPFISLVIGGFKNEDIDFDRFTYKCQRVVDLYNHTHNLQITMTSEITSSNRLGITVRSEDPDFIKNMVTISGQLAHVKEDTRYWESSQYYGTGKSGVIKAPQVVLVNGVAYLNEEGEVISSYYGTAPKNIERWAPRMLHISVDMEEGRKDLGWVYPTQLTCIDE